MQQALLKLEKQIDNLLKEKSDLQARIEELERENTGYQDRLEQAYKDDEAKADLLRKLDEPIMKLQAENEKLKERKYRRTAGQGSRFQDFHHRRRRHHHRYRLCRGHLR